jgi:hypothetical protein
MSTHLNHDPHDAHTGSQRAHQTSAEAATPPSVVGTFLWCLPPLLLTVVLIIQALDHA